MRRFNLSAFLLYLFIVYFLNLLFLHTVGFCHFYVLFM
jgi:hypothetical protein